MELGSFFGYLLSVDHVFGVYTFFAFIVLLLLYLIRPKPVKKTIPSLMFLDAKKNRKRMTSFFRRLIPDPLILFQALIILLLCLAILMPYTELERPKDVEHKVFVIDASASMQAVSEGTSHFSRAINLAKDNLGDLNSVILIKSTPTLALAKGTERETRSLLNALRPTDSTSAIGDAMLMAADTAEEGSEIVVLSDFSFTDGVSPLVARNILQSQGYTVRMVNLGTSAGNVGVVSATIDGQDAIIEVMNFEDEARVVAISGTQHRINIKPSASEILTVPLTPGTSSFSLDVDDDFSVDNKVFFSMPEEQKKRVLVLSSTASSPLRDVLSVMPSVEMEVAEPPILPDLTHDVIIIDQVPAGSIIAGTFDEIEERVRDGADFIIMPQTDMWQIHFRGLLPVSTWNMTKDQRLVNTGRLEKLENINYYQTGQLFDATLLDNRSIILAETEGGIPAIVLSRKGRGSILYYGIFDNSNDFRLTPDYPLFWIEMIEMMTSSTNPLFINRKVGSVFDVASGEELVSPSGRRFTTSTVLEEIGIYEYGSQRIAVNLIDRKESSLDSQELEDAVFETELTEVISASRFDFWSYLVGLAILVMLLEIWFIKRRGDV